MLVKILQLEIDLEDLDSNGDEHPVNKVPVLVDEELILTEPRAILCYLVGLFSNGNSLYPIDLKRRAMIDQRLFYDASVVYPSVMNVIVS
jgi:glutathione S-transferase